MHLSKFGLILLVLTAWGAAQQAVRSPADITRNTGQSICLIATQDEKGNLTGLGSGFVCANNRVATNFHVIQGATKIFIKFKGGGAYVAEQLSGFDTLNDLAILRLGQLWKTPLKLGNSDNIQPGERVVVISNPQGLENTVSDGLVSGFRELLAEQTWIQISAPISPGSSGGPVFNDRGEVIGVAAAELTSGQNLNFAIPVNFLKTLLENDQVISLKHLPRLGPQPEAHAPAAAPTNDFVLDGAWEATFSDSAGSGKLYFNLIQNSKGEVAGTYTASTGGGGTISGQIAKGALAFELTQNTAGCPGIYKAKVESVGDAMSGNYYGQDCNGPHQNGNLTMSRAVAGAPPPPAAPPLQYLPGDVNDLRHVRTVMVFTGYDLSYREMIVKELAKEPSITVVNDPKYADAVLVFGADIYSLGTYTYAWRDMYGNAWASSQPRAAIAGQGYVIRLEPPSIIRVLWEFKDTQTTKFERHPAKNFARNFIKTIQSLR